MYDFFGEHLQNATFCFPWNIQSHLFGIELWLILLNYLLTNYVEF